MESEDEQFLAYGAQISLENTNPPTAVNDYHTEWRGAFMPQFVVLFAT